ncbi:MAG: acyl carrier protein [Planctomycetota bacterium]
MRPNLRPTILDALHQVANEQGVSLPRVLSNELVLLECGLDSIGYAILVVELEQRFGFDPILLVKEPIYPTTLGEFICFYEQNQPQAD